MPQAAYGDSQVPPQQAPDAEPAYKAAALVRQPLIPSPTRCICPMPKSTAAAPNSQLREFHKLGRQVLAAERKCTPRGQGRYHYGSVSQIEERTGRSRTYVHCSRKFAALYPTEKDLNWICSLGPKSGKSLTTKHVLRLITVPDRQQRNTLARRCAAEGWSVERLSLAIRSIRPSQAGSGRRPPRPHDVQEALAALEQMAVRWTRWLEVLSSNDSQPKGAKLGDLPASVRRRLIKGSQCIGDLKEAVSRAIAKL